MNHQYQTKPVIVEAVQISKRMDLTSPDWWAQAVQTNQVLVYGMGKFTNDPVRVLVSSLFTGDQHGDEGDWVVRTHNNTLRIQSAEVFSHNYVKVTR